MELTVCGLNHRTARVELRDRVAIGPDRLRDGLSLLQKDPLVQECMILSTCNRTEVYTVTDGLCLPEDERHPAIRFLLDFHDLHFSDIESSLYHFEENDAVAHLFKVTCGLDSMVLGENQIITQVREAYSAACDVRCSGYLLNRLAHAAFRVGKEVRTKTALNEGSLSVSYAACDLACKVLGDLAGTRVLVIGAGETGELLARNMKKRGVKKMVVTNRTMERAETLATKLACTAIPINDLQLGLSEADIVVSCTASPELVVTREMVAAALDQRRPSAPLFLIDLAVPRDIEESTSDLDGVHLHNIDDLQMIVSTNSEKRLAEQKKAFEIVEKSVRQFERWRRTLVATPTIRDLQELFEQIRLSELDQRARQMTDEERTAADKATAEVVDRIVKLAIANIKTATTEPGSEAFLDAVRRLFDLHEYERQV